MKLCLIRHGLSKANVDETVYLTVKDHDIELTDIGQEQALLAGKNLSKELSGTKGKTFVFVSPYKRTRQTWAGIKSALCPITFSEQENPLLREQEYKFFADLEDMKTRKENRAKWGPFWYRYKNAEAATDVHQRVTVFWNYLTNQYLLGHIKEEDTVVIVTHEVVIRMFTMVMESLSHENAKVDVGNCDIKVCDLSKMQYKSSHCIKIKK